MDRVKIGSWFSAMGGILIALVSAEISHIHSRLHIFLDFGVDVPPWYSPFMNGMANRIGYYGLTLGILITAGAFLRRYPLAGGLTSLISSGLSVIVGVLLWSPPFYIARVIGVEAYSPPFLLGTILGVVGGGVTVDPILCGKWRGHECYNPP